MCSSPIERQGGAAGASSRRYRNPHVKPSWYKARQRSITPAQKRAEQRLWPQLGLSYSYNQPIDLIAAFGPEREGARMILEVGCGCGEALIAMARAQPETNFVGVDWFRSGVATCLMEVEGARLQNVRLVRADAALLLEVGLPPTQLFDEVKIFFPDPWKGSVERRVVRPQVVQQLSRRMRPHGLVHIATDVEGYPEQVRKVFGSPLQAGADWSPIQPPIEPPLELPLQLPAEAHAHADADMAAGRSADTSSGASEASVAWRRSSWRPSTKYARDGVAAGRRIDDLHFRFESLLDA